MMSLSTKVNRREFIKTTTAIGVLASIPLAEKTALAAIQSALPKLWPSGAFSEEWFVFSRLGFGPREGDREKYQALSKKPKERLQKYVELQLHPTEIADKDFEYRLKTLKLETQTKTLAQLWHDHQIVPNELRDKKMEDNKLRLQPVRETEMATWLSAVYSNRQLQEVLADFWHNHFNVYAWDNNIACVFPHYDQEVIRTHLFGNFRQMIEAVGKHPAMLTYLDNALNQSGNPNENYARELFELHTLGAENYLGTRDRESVAGYSSGKPIGYVDGDVYEAARCFSGWRFENGKSNAPSTGAFQYFEPWHDRFQKVVLGQHLKEYQSPMKDGKDVYDFLANHMGTARYVSRKLCRRLVSDQPSTKLVESVAKVFYEQRNEPDQLRRVVRALLLSDEFKNSQQQKMKRPFESVASMLRVTGADFTPTDGFQNEFQRTGQRLFQWRTPDGYPDDRYQWGGASSILERWRMANLIMSGSIDGVKINVDQKIPLAGREQSDAVAQSITQWIFGSDARKSVQKCVGDYLSTGVKPHDKNKCQSGVAIALMSPDFQWR